ncbi:MAG TPA: hypothetical protein VFS13_13965 [Steroidobacteraceae bacterium]|jgi:hypothetical protein|nr:hypothetical protein [Steroidobacteraceae bacterium]
MATKAKSVSLASLSKSIDSAVKLAARRHGVTFDNTTTIRNWEILGRYLRELPVHGDAFDVAATIAKSSGLKGTPVATKIGRDILVGIIARDLNVQLR